MYFYLHTTIYRLENNIPAWYNNPITEKSRADFDLINKNQDIFSSDTLVHLSAIRTYSFKKYSSTYRQLLFLEPADENAQRGKHGTAQQVGCRAAAGLRMVFLNVNRLFFILRRAEGRLSGVDKRNRNCLSFR
jgi:hypothetical protein